MSASGDVNYWAPARRDPVLLGEREGLWRWYWAALFSLLAIGFAIVVFMALTTGLFVAAEALGDMPNAEAAFKSMEDSPFKPGDPYSFILLWVTYFSVCCGVVAALSIRSQRFRLGLVYGAPYSGVPFLKAGGALAVILILSCLVQYAVFPGAFTMRELTAARAGWIAIAAGVLLFQTLGEEMMFRGFLLRLWGAVLPIRLIVVILISGVFISLHLPNPDVQADLMFNLVYFTAMEGLYYWVLFRTRSVMATWGMHWINNVVAFLIIAQLPGWNNEIAIFTYADPVLTGGGSYLFNPFAHALLAALIATFIALTASRLSPFYLEPAPVRPHPPGSLEDAAESPPPAGFPQPAGDIR